MLKRFLKIITGIVKYLFQKNIARTAGFFFLILILGFFLGRVTGRHILAGVLRGGRYSIFLYSPPFKYMESAGLISNPDELKRLEGYYSILDNKIIDTDLLIERYKDESPINKSAIVWLLGYSENKGTSLKFLSAEYDKADKVLKLDIKRSIERLDKSFVIKEKGEHDVNK